MQRRLLSQTVVAVLGLQWSLLAVAGQADNQQPIEVLGGNFVQQGPRLSYQDGFSLTQGSRQIESQNAVIHQDQNGGFERVELSGTPASWREQDDAGQLFRATANDIDYNVAAQTIELRGNVMIIRAQQEISGAQVRYDLRSGRVEGSGDPNDPQSRIRMRFLPPEQGSDSPPAAPESDQSQN